MKKTTVLISVLVLLLVFTGVAWACPPGPGEFTIAGVTTAIEPWPPEPGPDGKLRMTFKAGGGVSGDIFDGADFTYRERVVVDAQTFEGVNVGLMKIKADDGSKAFVAFGGRASATSVTGRWRILRGTGQYSDLRGKGTYVGTPDMCWPIEEPPYFECLGFEVLFSGQFWTD